MAEPARTSTLLSLPTHSTNQTVHTPPSQHSSVAITSMRDDETSAAAAGAVGSATASASDWGGRPLVSAHIPSAASPARFCTPPLHSPNSTPNTRMQLGGGSPHTASARSPAAAAAGLSVHTAAFTHTQPDDARNTPYPTAEIIQRTKQADLFRDAQQPQQQLQQHQQTIGNRPWLPPASIVTTRRSDSPDQSPTMDDLVSSELRPAPTTILESPQQPKRQQPQPQDPMPMSDASPEMQLESAIAPSTREQSSASESSSGRSLLSPCSTNSDTSPILPPSQAFAFRGQHSVSAISDESDEQQPANEQDDGAEPDQTLQVPSQSQADLITPPHISLQQQPPAVQSSAAAAPAADVLMLRASSEGGDVPPSAGVADLAHRIAPVQPPLPTWCGLPQPSQPTTKRIKTTPLSSPSSSRAPRLSAAIEAAAASASASTAAASSNDAVTASMFQFDTTPLTTGGLFAGCSPTPSPAPSSPRSSPRSSPPLHSKPSPHTSPRTSPSPAPTAAAAAAAASATPNYFWQLVCNPRNGGAAAAAAAVPESIALWTRPCWVIGRHTSCDLVLDHISISRLHARLLVHCITGQLYLQDLDSTHGTFVNGQRIVGMKKSATGASFQQLTDPQRTHGAISSFAISATPSPSAAGAFPLRSGSQIVFGASQKTWTLLQHDQLPAGSELHALPPRVPLSGGGVGPVLLAPPPLRKTLSDGSIQHSPVITAHMLSPAAAAALGTGAGSLPPPCSLGAGMLAPLKLLQTSSSLSNLADLQRRDANVHRKRKVVSFAADTKTRDGCLRIRSDAVSIDSACSTPCCNDELAESAESKMQTGEDEDDDDEDARPKRQGMTAEEICMQRKMAAAAAAVAVPILKLPSFPFAPRAFSAPIAGQVAARKQLAHVLATPSTPSLADRPSCGLESGAASVGAPSSRPLGIFPMMANNHNNNHHHGGGGSSSSTSAAASMSSASSDSAVGAAFSSGYSSASAPSSSSACISVMRQPSVSPLNIASSVALSCASASVAPASAAAVACRPSLKHARDSSADDDAALRDQADDDEEEKVDAHALLSPEQRQTLVSYECLLPQPLNSPSSAASFTSLSLMSFAAPSNSFPAAHASKTVPVVHGSSSSSSFAANGLLSPHHAIEAAVHTAQLGRSPHAGSPPPMQFAVAAAQAAALRADLEDMMA